jgi:GR25 family glycosyltransferase involved in LPS biosynthesis
MTRWPEPIDHTYILCNPEKEPERAAYLTQWLARHTIDSSVYTMGLSCYGCDITAELAHSVYNPWQNRKPVEKARGHNSYNLKLGEISLVLNWAAVAQAAVKAGHKVVMILESDVIFDDDFLPKLAEGLRAFDRGYWDFLSLSAGPNLRPQRNDDEKLQKWFMVSHYYHTRTTDAMIFKVDMMAKILETLFPFAEVLDWELNYQLSLHKSRSFWLDPPIIRQGSGKEYATTL